MNTRKIPLNLKILLPIFIGKLLIIILCGLYLRVHLNQIVEDYARQRVEPLANIIHNMSVTNGISDDVKTIINMISKEKDIEIVAVVRREPFQALVSGENNKIETHLIEEFIKSYELGSQILNSIKSGKPVRARHVNKNGHFGSNDYIYSIPIFIRTKDSQIIPASIFIQLEIGDVLDQIKNEIIHLLGIIILALLTSFLLKCFLLHKYILSPLNAIKKVIVRRLEGDVNAYVENLRDDEVGQVGAELNILFDKVENKNAELLSKTTLLNTVIENIPLCFFAKNVKDDFRMVIWNKKSEEIFGIKANKIIGKTDYDNFPKEEADFFRATDISVMHEGTIVDIPEEQVTTERGTWFAHTIKVPVFDKDGKPSILIGMLEDITVLKNARDNLLDEKTRLQTIMDSMLEGIITIDANGIIQSTNPGATRMFGYTNAEMVGKNVKVLMPEPDKSAHDKYLENYNKTGEARIIGKNRELVGIRKNGEKFPMTLSVKNMFINKQLCFIGLTRDITEQKQRENELEYAKNQAESANQLKSQFLANMSHELRTPMHAIITFSRQGIERITKWTSVEHEENLRLIKDSGERLLILLNDLLDLSKLEAGAVDYDMRMYDLRDIVSSVVKQMQSLIDDKRIKVDISAESMACIVECDLSKITQVIVNLISNAVKFTPEGKSINIAIKSSEQFVRRTMIIIDDEGDGVPQVDLEKIFDKFVQSSNAAERAVGTGLGLAISREIIQAHKGKIWAENNIEGGARFIILIPASQKDDENY